MMIALQPTTQIDEERKQELKQKLQINSFYMSSHFHFILCNSKNIRQFGKHFFLYIYYPIEFLSKLFYTILRTFSVS